MIYVTAAQDPLPLALMIIKYLKVEDPDCINNISTGNTVTFSNVMDRILNYSANCIVCGITHITIIVLI